MKTKVDGEGILSMDGFFKRFKKKNEKVKKDGRIGKRRTR